MAAIGRVRTLDLEMCKCHPVLKICKRILGITSASLSNETGQRNVPLVPEHAALSKLLHDACHSFRRATALETASTVAFIFCSVDQELM
jgi:hypothetical protein